jgi:hypothetical protein
MPRHQRCSVCRKPLEYLPCWRCSGKGFHRRLLVLKDTCIACRGEGMLMRCGDDRLHAIRRPVVVPGLASPPRIQPVKPLGKVAKNPRIGSGLRVTQQSPAGPPVVPPWDIRYPNPWHPDHPLHWDPPEPPPPPGFPGGPF